MVLGSLFGTRKARHGAAAGVVVLATGGLFLLRAHAATPPGGGPGEPVAMNPLTTTPLPPLPPPPRPLVPLADGPVGPDTVPFAGPHIHGTMAVSDARVLAGSPQPLYADVTLNADGQRATSTRRLAIVVVLDTSGSMEGEKLNEAKTAVKELVRDDA
jgi:Ca-activated chloride channel family protein